MQKLISALALLSLLGLTSGLRAQDMGHEVSSDTLEKYSYYDSDRLPPSFHAGRRQLVLDRMAPHSLALFLAASEKTRANDITYEYHQDPNFYYLTGCLEPKSALVLSADPVHLPNGVQTHEILFVESRNPAMETWTGHRLGPQGALSVLRLTAAMPTDSLIGFLRRVIHDSTMLYFRSNEPKVKLAGIDSSIESPARIRDMLHMEFPNARIDPHLGTVLAALRQVKTEDELRLMRKAISISNDAHNAVISSARPGWHEYEIQGLAEYTFTKNGAEYTAYPCIVGSGPNSTILHYETNRRETRPGDFIEMDMGSEYHGYAADVTRSFPISGHFTPEQRAIYDIVLAAQDSGIRACQVGAPFWSAHWAATRVIVSGLLKLGIIRDSADYRKYFMHGTSHYLGLDVHDAGNYGPLAPGNVLTVEPGIYIAEGSPCDSKWWNIGCRIEDDILVTAAGPVNLSAASPRRAEDVEALMNHRKNE